MKNCKYHPYIDDYINAVKSGEYKASKEVIKLVALVERKLEQGNIIIKYDEITEAKEFIERYFPFELYPAEDFILACVVGLFYEDGTLVFNEFFLLWGRGAGKNGFIAALAFWFTGKQKIDNYNVEIVALSKKQAETSFLDVHKVLEKHESKMKKFFNWTLQKISFKKTNSTLSYHTNNAKTKDGLRPGAIIFDEVHEYESYDNIKVFTSALGKVECARRFYLTTDGNIRGGVLDDFKDESDMILNGELPNSRMFPFIAKIDEEEEMHDVDMWEKANPGINHLPHLKAEMLNEYENLKIRPSLEIEFTTKRMNWPQVLSANGVADWDKITATNQPFLDFKGADCIGAIDYADIRDFVGVGLLFKRDGKRYWKHHTFINHRSLKLFDYKVDIQLAIKQGLVTIIYEETNKPEIIAAWFLEQSKMYNIKKISSDHFRINYLREVFEEYGFTLDVARSGTKTHTELEAIIDEMFAYSNLVYGDDLMMRWYTNNVYIKRDGKGNITYEKIEPQLRKTDGFFAFLHALQFDLELNESTLITEENIDKMFKSYSF